MSMNDMMIQAAETGRYDEVKLTIAISTGSYRDTEQIAIAALQQNAPEPIVELALQSFLESAQQGRPLHGYWVHSLSHFTEDLWQRRMTEWIKTFNVCAFQGAIRYRDDNCSNRLLGDFVDYAAWDDDPADFGLTAENLAWVDWNDSWMQRLKVRIDAAPYADEASWIVWKLTQPQVMYKNHPQLHVQIINVEAITPLQERLAELGFYVDPKAIATMQSVQAGKLEQELEEHPDHWNAENIRKAIAYLREEASK